MSISQQTRTALAGRWAAVWPGTTPVARWDELADRFPDQWVRLHSLPESKQYPDDETEYETVFLRHHTLLRELAGPDHASASAILRTMSWSTTARPTRRSQATVSVAPGARHWVSELTEDDPDPEWRTWSHVYLNPVRLTRESLDPVLRLVADDMLGEIIIALESLDWLYRPYPGGVDIFLPSKAERDALSTRHQDWCPPPGYTGGPCCREP
ncbi:MAG: hypothetical protein QM708_15325 [Propioniciclava sp.]|uniref:DUF3885 domain-containing protein n=1 Tax=Propioniciclava sp. TaxID=2038686 RepID=UPI0039E4087D